MEIFKQFGKDISYRDILQNDGAFSVAHVNYNKSPLFFGVDAKTALNPPQKTSIHSREYIDDVLSNLLSFDGTESSFNQEENLVLWKNYWFEYMNAFDKLISVLPESIVTSYIGRQSIELGLKYLLLKLTGSFDYTHNIGELSKALFSKCNISVNYMEEVDCFCESYSNYIEGGNVEYFRFPQYKKNTYFSGSKIDINWLSYNFVLILLKLVQFDKDNK